MKALVLVAGKGTRLKPLTSNKQKCMIEINGIPILKNCLDILQNNGIEETIIVIGYRGNEVKKKFLDYNGMKLTFVENKDYETTNNIYSVWLAKKYLDTDFLLIEGDIFFEDKIIKKLLKSPFRNCSVLDHYMPLLQGSVIDLDCGIIENFYLPEEQHKNFDYSDKFKTVNIYKISKELSVKFFNMIKSRIKRNFLGDYYELIFKEIIDIDGYTSLYMRGLVIKGCKWVEIDTKDDIIIAEKIFR